ncbi:MAG TPA: hypothetical protein VFF28_02280 [Candidatus Nanoarchaeia archaeon]|nr:hypothetical protein [Candidatus Nanoarchaeia archaeon]
MKTGTNIKLSKSELCILYRAIKIMQSGEALLGIDIDRKVVPVLAKEILKYIDAKTAKKIDKEAALLVKAAEEASEDYND